MSIRKLSSTTPDEFIARRLPQKDVQKIGQALVALEERHGDLTPELVVNAARSKRSPLHERFQWDDTAAAHSYRLVQAAWLIRTVKVRVIIADKPEEARAFVHVVKQPTAEPSSRGDDCEGAPVAVALGSYVRLSAALENPDWRAQMLTQARNDLETFRRKYRILEELSDVMGAIERELGK
jgi:hypothetical protein